MLQMAYNNSPFVALGSIALALVLVIMWRSRRKGQKLEGAVVVISGASQGIGLGK